MLRGNSTRTQKSVNIGKEEKRRGRKVEETVEELMRRKKDPIQKDPRFKIQQTRDATIVSRPQKKK